MRKLVDILFGGHVRMNNYLSLSTGINTYKTVWGGFMETINDMYIRYFLKSAYSLYDSLYFLYFFLCYRNSLYTSTNINMIRDYLSCYLNRVSYHWNTYVVW